MSHNAPFCNRNVHTCAHFCYKIVHYWTVALWDLWIRSIARSSPTMILTGQYKRILAFHKKVDSTLCQNMIEIMNISLYFLKAWPRDRCHVQTTKVKPSYILLTVTTHHRQSPIWWFYCCATMNIMKYIVCIVLCWLQPTAMICKNHTHLCG